jgi:type II secretory pathway component PulJ
MKKPLQIALVLGVIVCFGAAIMLYQRLQDRSQQLEQSVADYAELQADEQQMRAEYGKAIDEIAAIQDSLNTIVLGEEGMRTLTTQLDQEVSLTQSGGDAALARIAVIKAGIQRTKERIQELDARLKESGVRLSGLEKMIRSLRQAVAEKEVQVAQLTERVDELQTEVTAQAVVIEDSRRELGTIYYTYGSKDDLKDAGLIVSKGGVLGFGKTLEPSGQLDQTLFTALDTDLQTVIHIPAEKAKVLSDQPPASYQLVAVGDQLELHIVDPKAFRTVKHVVIVTT